MKARQEWTTLERNRLIARVKHAMDVYGSINMEKIREDFGKRSEGAIKFQLDKAEVEYLIHRPSIGRIWEVSRKGDMTYLPPHKSGDLVEYDY